MQQHYRILKDWRFALMSGLMGIIVPVVIHLLPPPFHIPFNWGVPLGWGAGVLTVWILARFCYRR